MVKDGVTINVEDLNQGEQCQDGLNAVLTLQVTASDTGSPPLTSTVDVTINIEVTTNLKNTHGLLK